MLNVLQKQESEDEEILCRGGEGTPPHYDRKRLPRITEPQSRTMQLLFRGGSQAVQLPLIQAFPVFKVVIQVLHKIGKVCKSWRNDKTAKLAFLLLDL